MDHLVVPEERLWEDVEALRVLQDFNKNDRHKEWLTGRDYWRYIRDQEGFGPFMVELVKLTKQNNPACRWDVVCTHWSADQVRGVFDQWLSLYEGADRPTVIANDIREVETALPSWALELHASYEQGTVGPIQNAIGKLRATEKLLAGPGGRSQVIYIGFGPFDIQCLSRFGGLIVGNMMCCNVTAELLREMGFTVPHVQNWRGELICWAHDFYDVLRSGYLIKWLGYKNERPNFK